MSASFIRAGESSSANITAIWFLAGVCSDVCSEVIRAREVPLADQAMEWFLSTVSAHVSFQLISSGEASWAFIDWACIGSLAHWNL